MKSGDDMKNVYNAQVHVFRDPGQFGSDIFPTSVQIEPQT